MESIVPLLFAAVVGFQHALEADHLVAVSSIVTKRKNTYMAIKDGIWWGLGHTSIILLIGFLILVSKITVYEKIFSYLEVGVGIMLVILGTHRLNIFSNHQKFKTNSIVEKDNHYLAYSIGVVHGLAGSGAMILLVMTEIKELFLSMVYLFIFGVGSILGMLMVAGIFSLPFSKNFKQFKFISSILALISSLLCIGLGFWIIYKNIYG